MQGTRDQRVIFARLLGLSLGHSSANAGPHSQSRFEVRIEEEGSLEKKMVDILRMIFAS